MVQVDRRRALIVSTAGHFFGVPVGDETYAAAVPVLEKFLDVSAYRTLCARPGRDANGELTLILTGDMPPGGNTLVFFKLAASRVTEENFHDLVQVASTGGGGGSTLVEAIRRVWGPVLQSSGVDSSVLKKLEDDILGPRAPTSLAEEEIFWQKRGSEARRSSEKRSFGEIAHILKSMRVELESAGASREGLAAMEEALEAVSGYADDLWKQGGSVYSEDRTRSLLDIVGNEVVLAVRNLVDLAANSGSRARDEALTMGASVCEKWVQLSEKLTSLFWPHHSLRPWKSGTFRPTRCARLGERLRQMAEIRAQHRQLARLLSPAERNGLGIDELLQSLDEFQIKSEDDWSEIDWERLKRRTEEGLAPAEERVAGKLKKQLADASTPASLASEFRRYGDLMKREALRRALRGEREALLAAFDDLIDSCQADPDTGDLLDTPRILQEVQSARAAELRLENLRTLGKELLSDLPGYEKVAKKIATGLRDAEKRRQHLVDSWVAEVKAAISRKELTLGTDGAVVELTGAKMMRVNYEPKLMRLVREARALSSQGVELPREARDLVEQAGALAGRARALQQVATFHNTIGDRMILSQRPLMLAAALELDRAVRDQSGVVWSDPLAVDAYTARLRDLVRKFARQNAELAAKHSTVLDLVKNLLSGDAVNLANSQATWKETLRNMRAIVDGVEAEHGNTAAWKLHWDRQLLKVLDVAYRAALPSLLRRLPEVKVELTFREGSLQWRPSLEEVRAKLYSGIRRFLAIPTNFRGVGDPADGHFGDLVQRSAYLFGEVYREAEILLSAMESFRAGWMSLAAPARIDAGERLKGSPPQEWERSFKEAKQWAQEVGRLRGVEVKLWCVTVDTGTTRNDLESASRRYWERLSSDLRAEASSRLAVVADFLSSAAKELDRRPRSVEEVGSAHEAHLRIQQRSAVVAEELEAVSGLGRVLAAWTREGLEGISGARAAWEGLEERLERHRSVVAKRLEDAKTDLRHRAAALRDERERFEARWSSKPEEETPAEWVTSTRERWQSLAEQRDLLDADCRKLGLELKDFLEDYDEGLAALRARLEAEESDCTFRAEFLDELKSQEAEEWTVARRRLPRLHDWLDSWETRVRSRVADLKPESDEDRPRTDTFVERKIREIRTTLEAVQLLRGDELAEEHWLELRPLLGLGQEGTLRDLTLGHLLGCAKNIEENAQTVKDVTKRAAAESGIRQALLEVESWEGSASLGLQEFKDSGNATVVLVKEYGGLLGRVGELRLFLEGAKGASSYERFSGRAARCETALSELEERIKLLGVLQRKWIYLEPVYGGGAAPNDSARWPRADKEFRYLMGEVSRDPRVSSLRRLPLPAMTSLKDSLERCQRCLDEFLEEKRSAYPRLYFLSDDDLLELVSGTGRGLETHLPKLFQGVGSILKVEDRLEAVVSPEGEVLKLAKPVDLTEPLPTWLSCLEEEVRRTLRQTLEKCLSDSTPDPSSYPAQVLLLAERIRFTERCELALKEGKSSAKTLVDSLQSQRARYRGLEDAGDELTALKARALLLDTVHHLNVSREVLECLRNGEEPSWTWSRQLRSYRTNAGPVIRCAGAEFPYRFEYQGAAVGLVRTKLTERCFLALTQAMKLGLGGSPTGPAGTGKTETVKALGAILGRLVLVFNCDEGMDAGSMHRILGGLAQAGAWGCFDEFNRLEEGTLSSVAMSVRPLQEAVRDGERQVDLGGRKVTLDPHCCVFITMNPAGADYGGRNKLPDSLARLFRPIGMAHPDRSDIVRALLECAGFLEAAVLAERLVETFDISARLLSKQPHYDWGLRALRSVLDALPSGSGSSDESSRLLAAIRASTLPKLTETDARKFRALLKDVFPSVDPSGSWTDGKDLRAALAEVCESRNLPDEVLSRCAQLHVQLRGRAGVAMVGPPGSGKTLVRRTLAEALAKIGQPVVQLVAYPGAMPKSRLLGRVDPRTREWKEGVLSRMVSSAGDSATWIVLDGDVEPGWAEALNSALDDNRLLTLPNGVGIRLGPGTRFVFETHGLSGASPATVSRLGVVHLPSASPSSLITSSRLAALPSVSKDLASAHLGGEAIDWALKDDRQFSASGLIGAVLSHLARAETKTSAAYALLVSLCGQVADPSERDQLARRIYRSTDCWCPDPERPFDALYSSEIDRLEPFSGSAECVETAEGPVLLSGSVRRALAAIAPWIDSGHPVVVRGPPGCGKETVISAALSLAKDRGEESFALVKGSSLYGTQDLLARLKRVCVKMDSSSHGRAYKPRVGERVGLILKDLHLASMDLQEVLRELLQEGGFHEEDLEFARLPLALICTADSSTKLHPRLQAILASHYVPPPSAKDLEGIVELHLRRALKDVGVSVDSWISRMSPAIVDVFQTLSPSPDSTSWTPKDVVLWSDSMRFYPDPEGDAALTRHLLDAGHRLLDSRFTGKDRSKWESRIASKSPGVKYSGDDVYVSKGGGAGLIPLSAEEWKLQIENAVARCAREGDPVEASISPHLLQTVAGICWALGCGQRGVVLTGRAGAGRKSAAKLAATLTSLRVVESAPGRGRAAVRSSVQAAGIDGEPTLLLLEEHHGSEEGLDVLAGAIVANGELPGLFSPEELDGLVAPLAELSRREDFSGTLEQFFHHRLRNLLRVVIIRDAEDVLEERSSRSGLGKSCILVGPGPGSEWWSSEGPLTELALQKSGLRGTEAVKMAVNSHLRAPRRQRAPARFLALLRVWLDLRDKWTEEIESELASLEAGIGRLREAGDRVSKLEEEASRQRQELEAEKGRAAAALEQISATMRGATGQRGEMTTLKAETERESAELARRKADIEGELGKVEPLVEQAAQAVAGIGADALAEVRSLRAPPAPVRDVLEGVLRLMGIRDTSWNSMKTFLAKRGVKDEIRSWDARRSSAASLEAVEKLVKERPESFEEKTARRASVAAAPLAAWVLANLQYGQILQQVAPLEREQRALARKLAAAEAELGRLATGLTTVESRVAQLQEELAEHSRGAATLQLRFEATEAGLETARTLLRKLDTEHRDWQLQSERLTERRAKVEVEAVNAAALLVYQDPTRDQECRRTALNLLVTERERLSWRAQGLPGDVESLVGAACALKGPLVPLFVDPAGVAVAWLKAGMGSNLEVTRPEGANFSTSLELAVRFGKPLLIEEILQLPGVLLPLLRRRPLRLGERSLPAREGFRLFLATRRDELDGLPSEADSVLFEVAFGAGTGSLAERFVEKALLKETPSLETERREALEREERLSGERDAARVELLAQLGAARGQDLLQEAQGSPGGLLSSLEATQSKAKEIAVALEASRRSLEEVSRRAEKRLPLARFAAELFEAVQRLATLNPLYVFSAEAFADVYLEAEAFEASLAAEDRSEDMRKTVQRKLVDLTLRHCTMAAYRRDRLPLALHLALSLEPVPDDERSLLLNGGSRDPGNRDFSVPEWIPEERKPAARALGSALPQLAEKLKSTWLDHVDAVYADKTTTSFQKTLIVLTLRPDHLRTSLTRFVAERLGTRDIGPPSWSLGKIAEDPGSHPVLLLLSPGADPGPELRGLAASRGVPVPGFSEVSLSRGQVAQAEAALETACRNGDWLLLSNLQLAPTWLPHLEALLRSPVYALRKPETRVWLTTEQSSGFYPGLAGLCLKVAYEPPEGVKRNAKGSLRQLRLRQRGSEEAAGTLMLAWLHAVLQERRRFVPQGWTREYEWSEADTEAACELVVKGTTTKKGETVDWEAGQGLLDAAVYGGRIQDSYDSRALTAILRSVWSKDVFSGREKLGGVVNVPEAVSQDALRVLDRLGEDDLPDEYFGLPANALGAWERSTAESALARLRGMSLAESGISKDKASKDFEKRMRKDLRDLLESRIPDPRTKSTDLVEDHPLRSYLNDERRLTSSLLELVRGEVDDASFKDPKTPKQWLKHWPEGPEETLPFVAGLVSRHRALAALRLSAEGLPAKVDLSWLARPRAFLAALKQYTARSSGEPLEGLRLRASWLDGSQSANWRTSVVIEGLLVSGALIENRSLKDLEAGAAPVAAAPPCRAAFLLEEVAGENSATGGKAPSEVLQVPVYVDSKRTSVICSLPVGCPGSRRDVWLRRGVALHPR
ncbi:cytoplasmic dynein 2 heavy chain 1 [Orussus abietinus]|uniref:cytoplasmic dynein 2 heavy chain 1 n=1 Tax=Orussus abietinus TaxID=222816 RepID=UPI000C71616E|nr:cytoplasmic dynein 2 heavy chain 1 [Orussus abietinus]